jgi:hypothetical protein
MQYKILSVVLDQGRQKGSGTKGIYATQTDTHGNQISGLYGIAQEDGRNGNCEKKDQEPEQRRIR